MKRLVIVLVLVMLACGCRTILKINNKSDPQSFDPLIVITTNNFFYNEISIDVPEEIRNDEFEVTRVDIFADIFVRGINNPPLDIALYIALEPGSGGLDDPDANQVIARDTIWVAGTHRPVKVKSPALALKAMHQEKFYFKTVVRSSGDSEGLVNVDDVYTDVWLERETKGLFPFFYLF